MSFYSKKRIAKNWVSRGSNCPHNSEYFNIPFTMKELRHALQHTKNSSPGEDTIFAEMVKNLPSNVQEALLKNL